MFDRIKTLNCGGTLLSLDRPIIMGILNVTPDSFFDGGRYIEESAILTKVERMLQEGASIIDIGGMSSRPGAALISVEEELNRLIPVIQVIKQQFQNIIISVDTVRAEVAKAAVLAGASLINDISAGRYDENMYELVASLKVPYILMHMQNDPSDMQENPTYESILTDILDFFILEVGKLRELGVKDIVIDPGFGFGKTITHNYTLLKKMHVFQSLDLPILAGLSRKSMIYKVLETVPENALNGTSVLNLVALEQGASILRVHDVKPAQEVIRLYLQLNEIE